MPDEAPFDSHGVEKALQFKTKTLPTEPLRFSVSTEDGSNTEWFLAVPWITGYKFLKYSRMMTEGGLQSTLLVDQFFQDVMEPVEYERFVKWIDNPDFAVTTEELANIFLGLFSRYSAGPSEQDRPTQPPSPSVPGPGGTEATSKENASSEESPPTT